MKFVWSESSRFVLGAGGTENHTIERAKELSRRGMSVEIIIISTAPYEIDFADIPIRFLTSAGKLSEIDDTIVYVARGQDVPTKRQSFIFLHFPIHIYSDEKQETEFLRACRRSKLITNSHYSRSYWSDRIGVGADTIAVVYPFAQPLCGEVNRLPSESVIRVLYPNRIQAEKGLFVFLEAASYFVDDNKFVFTIMGAGNGTASGSANEQWLRHVPYINYLEPVANPAAMAAIYAENDIVVVPSRDDVWQEPFGMTSVEAQAAGCRVIASDSGGLRETDCGLVDFIPAGNAVLLKQMISKVATYKPVSSNERNKAKQMFTLKTNVDNFLKIVTKLY